MYSHLSSVSPSLQLIMHSIVTELPFAQLLTN